MNTATRTRRVALGQCWGCGGTRDQAAQLCTACAHRMNVRRANERRTLRAEAKEPPSTECECGNPKALRAKACDRCTLLDMRRAHPAVEVLDELGRATVSDIARAIGYQVDAVGHVLRQYRARGVVSVVGRDEDSGAQLWRVAI